MPVGKSIKKFTWLLDYVEVKGIVRDIDRAPMADGEPVGQKDGFLVEPDPNYRHLVNYVPGYGPPDLPDMT